ncbi:glycosyltransferase [Wenyingzhuangia sp. chi5]|uniref:Glycosyltransferase n=1 Tax=Wenyingzhuangia gilva TaxID=3057677 RepID=A0ABT8VNB6_9FLAO|nr:glycosyltransferase [Wenyingzhuangia sp. chi5]MDO3693453.1 glycosyltransferase [Wenyingzhuangia sp. chi5]
MPKILFFYPDNPLNINQGNNARANALLHYFKTNNFEIDFVGEESLIFSKEDLLKLKNSNLINKAELIRKRKKNGIRYLFAHSIPNKIKNKTSISTHLGAGQQKDFETILKQNTYDYILISYVLFASFIGNKKLLKGAKTIVDTHDFLTSQFQNHKNVGNLFKVELKLLNQFDSIWAISVEEKYIFNQFLPHKNIELIPHGIDDKHQQKYITPSIDIFYVASPNPHNITAAKWFFNHVYPLLPKEIKITIVGRIVHFIDDYDNVTKIEKVKDLSDFYKKSKITICPMLSGTGLKIKVVESLSYGIPVVCNERGVDGLLNKINNGCLTTNNPKIFAKYVHQLLTENEFYNTQRNYANTFFDESLSLKNVHQKLNNFFNI